MKAFQRNSQAGLFDRMEEEDTAVAQCQTFPFDHRGTHVIFGHPDDYGPACEIGLRCQPEEWKSSRENGKRKLSGKSLAQAIKDETINLERSIARHDQIRVGRLDSLSPYDKNLSSGGMPWMALCTALYLTKAHVSYSRTEIARLELLASIENRQERKAS